MISTTTSASGPKRSNGGSSISTHYYGDGQHYEYDPNGNRTLGPAGEVGVSDNQERLTSYGATTYAYGANGELQTKSNGGQTTTYTYDVLGTDGHCL